MRKLADTDFIKEHFDEIMKSIEQIKNSNMSIVCGSVAPEEIYGYAVNIPDLRLIVVDYLQLIRGVTADYKSTSLASSEIARTAKEMEIPILVLSQLARDNTKNPADKKPWTQRLKDSGNIENDCDWALNISRNQNAKLGTKESREAVLNIGYHRQGGERLNIPLEYDYDEQIYLEVPTEAIADYKWYDYD
jgi:replicative DNA helicase